MQLFFHFRWVTSCNHTRILEIGVLKGAENQLNVAIPLKVYIVKKKNRSLMPILCTIYTKVLYTVFCVLSNIPCQNGAR